MTQSRYIYNSFKTCNIKTHIMNMIKHYIIQVQACWKFVHIFSACRFMQFWSDLLSMWPFPLARFSYIAKFICDLTGFGSASSTLYSTYFWEHLGTFTATPKPLIDFRRPNIVVLSLVVVQEIPYCFEHGAVLATGKTLLFKCWEGHGCKILDYFECNSLEHECLNMVFFSC